VTFGLPPTRLRSAEPRALNTPEAVIQAILTRRGLSDADLDLRLERLASPNALGGLEAAAVRVVAAMQAGQGIAIVGDFDADGVTASALLMLALPALARAAGWPEPQLLPLIPSRFLEGYGLSPSLADRAAAAGCRLLITVDNGISALAGVARAREHGLDVVVTDHHLPGAVLPADAVLVNPNLPGDAFPSKALAGVGVAFYLAIAVRARLRTLGHVISLPVAQWLDLVAIGTVADVAALDANNRILVAEGVARIRAGACRPGVRVLLRLAGRDPDRLAARDLGFTLGPRLNAAGRLADMGIGLACLLAEDEASAEPLAAQLVGLNRERQEIEQEMLAEAESEVQALAAAGPLPPVLVLFQPHWHEGVVGLLAGRLRERWQRPAFALAPAQEPGWLKGSGRSVEGLHLRDALAAIAVRNPELLPRFGGHAMAAGLSAPTAALPRLMAELASEIGMRLGPEQPVRWLESDGRLDPALLRGEAALGLAERLERLLPWGTGLPAPAFDGRFEIAAVRPLKDGSHLKLWLRPGDGGEPVPALWFNPARAGAELQSLQPGRPVHALYQLRADRWQGQLQPILALDWAWPL